MDIEKTIEFLLRQQASAQARHDRQMEAIRKTIQTGMRLIVKNEEQIKARAAQEVAETKLQGLIDALRRGGNGSRSGN